MASDEDIERIVLNPAICVGKPVIRGTRLKIEFILELLAEGWSHEQILKEYQLDAADIRAVLKYAQKMISDEFIITLSCD